jgi:hypothetical protein
MSDAIIVGLIAASASIIGTLVSYLKNSKTNTKKFKSLEFGLGDLKKKFSSMELRMGGMEEKFNGLEFRMDSLENKFHHFETNGIKHVELDPNGATMRSINARFDVIEADVKVLKVDMKGIKHYAGTLDGILLDKGMLTNQQAAVLNTHLDNALP